MFSTHSSKFKVMESKLTNFTGILITPTTGNLTVYIIKIRNTDHLFLCFSVDILPLLRTFLVHGAMDVVLFSTKLSANTMTLLHLAEVLQTDSLYST